MSTLLDEYFTDAELCNELGVSHHTTRRWRLERIGPPVTYIRRKPHYRKTAAREWLLAREGVGEGFHVVA